MANIPTNVAELLDKVIGFTVQGQDLLTVNMGETYMVWNNRDNYSYHIANNVSGGWKLDGSNISWTSDSKLTLNLNGDDENGWTMTTSGSIVNAWGYGSTVSWFPACTQQSIWGNGLHYSYSRNSTSIPTNISRSTLLELATYLELHFRCCLIKINGADYPPSYNWQSVPNISGKNGILQSLVQIKEEAINDGEPVSEATVLSFDSLGNINIPSVIDEQMPVDPSDVTSVTATYLIPALENGTYEGIKLLVKKGSIPTSEDDADKVVNLDEPTSILRIDSKSVGNLDEDSHYYFVVKLVDEIGTEATSEPKDIWTSHSEGWNFDYTGSIQTFTAPKTGIYQLETWGAQGGDATDGTLTARGGYGAYAVGEILLTQGDTLYINVGGQNGYGGGGNYASPNE